VWWDRELIAGPAFADCIEEELGKAKCVLVAWSQHSVASHWCRDEAAVGLERNVLVPFRIDDVMPPLGFRSSHTPDLAGWPDREGELGQLLAGVAECLKVAIPVPNPVRRAAPQEKTLLILPFRQTGGEEDDYFGDGLIEDIISELSHIQQLQVISRSTAFEFKNSPTPPDAIGRRLGATAVLHGSIRRSGDKGRVSAALVDTESGKTVWSETFDRALDDIFAVQDDLTNEIVTALDVKLVHGEQARLNRSRYTSLEAGHIFYRGLFEFHRFEPETMLNARRLFSEFVEMEPDSVLGYAWLTTTWAASLLVQWETPRDALPAMQENAAKALAIDPENAAALIGNVYFNVLTGDLDAAYAFARRAVRSAPSSDEALFARGWVEMFLGRFDQSIVSLEKALRLAPIPSAVRLGVAGTAYRNAQRFDKSIETFRTLIEREPQFLFGYTGLASALALSGEWDDAREMVGEVLRIEPEFTVERFITPDFYHDPEVMRGCARALAKAGMPSASAPEN
jgi:adenylate cyclase